MIDPLRLTDHWLVVNKPAGLNVERLWDYPSVEERATDYLRAHSRREPYVGIVHRLDRPVSGVLLLARKKSTLRELNRQFAEKEVRKVYWAMTAGEPPAATGTLEHYLLKDQKNKRAEALTRPRAGAVRARLEYRVLARTQGVSCLEIRPLSGKFHQIRVQLAAVGCPILGDVKYGGPAGERADAIALHARGLRFVDPRTGQAVTPVAPLPDDGRWALWPTDH